MNRTFEQILSSDYHVSLEDNRRDESMKLAAEKYAEQFKAQEQKPVDIIALCLDWERYNHLYGEGEEAVKEFLNARNISYLQSIQKPVWVKASDREPESNGNYYVKCKINGVDAKEIVELTDDCWMPPKGYDTYESYLIIEWLDEQSIQKPIDNGLAFAKWLEENTVVEKEERITLYRYRDKNNEWGNYILDDIYHEYLDLGEHPEKEIQKPVANGVRLKEKDESGWSYDFNFLKSIYANCPEQPSLEQIEDVLKAINYDVPQKPITDEEIEALAEKEYPKINYSDGDKLDSNMFEREGFIKGFKAALKPDGNLIDALTKINQMSDCGSPEATIIRMKEIASEALKLTSSP